MDLREPARAPQLAQRHFLGDQLSRTSFDRFARYNFAAAALSIYQTMSGEAICEGKRKGSRGPRKTSCNASALSGPVARQSV